MQVLAIKRDRTNNNWILVGFGGMSFTAAFQHDMEQSPFFWSFFWLSLRNGPVFKKQHGGSQQNKVKGSWMDAQHHSPILGNHHIFTHTHIYTHTNKRCHQEHGSQKGLRSCLSLLLSLQHCKVAKWRTRKTKMKLRYQSWSLLTNHVPYSDDAFVMHLCFVIQPGVIWSEQQNPDSNPTRLNSWTVC